MSRLLPCLLLLTFLCIGCNTEADTGVENPEPEITEREMPQPSDDAAPVEPTDNDAVEPGDNETDLEEGAALEEGADLEEGVSANNESTVVELTPENTEIQFVGLHTGDEPNPRRGGFREINGQATIEADRLQNLELEIDTSSLYTEIDKLTNHLKSADFFDVRQHPTATFKSTNIEVKDDGTSEVTGDLTMHGTTESITFPAEVKTAEGFAIEAEFQLDRTRFGMDYGLDNVEKEVTVAVRVGEDL